MKKILPLLPILVALFGCSTLSKDPYPLMVKAIQVAVSTGSSIALAERPEWLPQFTQARDSLGALLTNGKLDGADLLRILQSLPVKELRSETARVVIANAVLLLDDYITEYTNIENVAALPIVGKAIFDGLDSAVSYAALDKAKAKGLKSVKRGRAGYTVK